MSFSRRSLLPVALAMMAADGMLPTSPKHSAPKTPDLPQDDRTTRRAKERAEAKRKRKAAKRAAAAPPPAEGTEEDHA